MVSRTLVGLCLLVAVPRAAAFAVARAQAAGAKDLAALPIEAGRRALKEGKREEAVHHLTAALAFAPDRAEVLQLLLEAAAGDADAKSLWAHAWARAAVPMNGALQPLVTADAKLKALLPADDARPVALASLRAGAVEELVKLARDRERESAQKPDQAIVARWLQRLALDLARESPQLMQGYGYDLSPRWKVPDGLVPKVVKALEQFGSNELGSTRTDHALRAGRILQGLAQELSWTKDLQGPKPSGLGDIGRSAAALLGTARREITAKSERPWTIDELLALDGDQAEAFTRAHASFASPGVATSTTGKYRIETDCGFNTLLGAAQTIEMHHERLAKWYGSDPFATRPGLCRIVPEASGLESEGVPFWWAAGFQGGDVTTVRFSVGSIEGLGHLLTHELTHRFDGALFPGIPSWLAEGKAVWTGGAYAICEDEKFEERWANIGTIEAAFIKGYGDLGKLTKLITGTLDDYRDNYVAGFALYVYLHTRKPQGTATVFADRLVKFQKEARSKKGKEHFEECFCDGKEGRPLKLEGFVKDWSTWLAAFYWQSRPKTTEWREYVGFDGKKHSPWAGMVYDEPTWVWSRSRAEPRFGQDQFALAGRLWLECGDRTHAIPALICALAVDGRRPDEEALLADALQKESRPDAAWCLRSEIEFPYGARIGAPPFFGALSKTKALLDAFDAAIPEAQQAVPPRPATAGALHAERERLAAWLGLERSAAPPEVDLSKLLRAKGSNAPFDPVARPLAPGGWGESGLTDYEERRVKGLFYVDDEAVLHVGRQKPREGTGTIDRGAAQVHAFALAPEWILPGTWRLDATIRFTTSFVAGAVVFGYTEREANYRFGFNAGDFMYAIGASEKEPEFTGVGWGISGLRDRDGGLGGSTAGGGFDFGGRAPGFDLTIDVDGALAIFSINGKEVGRYHTVDGAPIEGQIGFATSMGAIDVRGARVTRLERSRLAPRQGFAPTGMDLGSARSLAPWDSWKRDVSGLLRASQGTLLLWLSPPETPIAKPADVDDLLGRIQWDVRELATLVEKESATQRVVVAAPAAIGEEGRARLEAQVKKLLGDDAVVMLHAMPQVSSKNDPPVSRRLLLFVDSAGVARIVSEFQTAELVRHDTDEKAAGFSNWLKVFREHGKPPRKLPEVTREAKPAKDGG
jgi:hypothetical protein